jgi:hypothetical protein
LCGVCLRVEVWSGGGHEPEAGRFGDVERPVEIALRGGELGGLGELPSVERKCPWRIGPSSARIVRQVWPVRVSATRMMTSARKQIMRLNALVLAVDDGPQ